ASDRHDRPARGGASVAVIASLRSISVQRGDMGTRMIAFNSIRIRIFSRHSIRACGAIVVSLTLAVVCVAAPVSAAPGQAEPQAAAIQSVVEQANQEQVQALATGETSVMS